MEPASEEEEGSSSSASPTEVSHLLADNLGTLLEDSRTLRELSNICEASLLSNKNKNNIAYSVRLQHLQAKVTSLEEKLNLLRGVVREEQTALDELEALDEQMQRRNRHLKALIEKQKRAAGFIDDANYATPKSDESTVWSSSLGAPQRVRIPMAARQQEKQNATPSPAPTKQQAVALRLQRVTQSELESIPRTSRARISLSLLNEALMEIEQVLIQKFELLASSLSSTRKNSAARRNKKWQHDVLTDDDKAVIGDRLWVTEQELRSSCPFFRHGESTARAILLLLRTLHRLQQVPRKQPDFLYVVVLSSLPSKGVV